MKKVLSILFEILIYIVLAWLGEVFGGLYGLIIVSTAFLIVKLQLQLSVLSETATINRVAQLYYLIGISRELGVTKKSIADLYNDIEASTISKQEKDAIRLLLSKLE